MYNIQNLGHQLKLIKMKKILIAVFASAVLFACKNEKKPAIGVELRVSKENLKMWNSLKNQYTLYAQKDAAISSVDQLAGKTLLIAFVLPTSEDVTAQGGDAKSMETFVGDAMQVINAFRMNPKPSLQNNPELYLSNLLEQSDQVGIVLESVADTLGLTKSPKLVRLNLIQ